VGVSKDEIKLGSVNMHGMALGNLITAPLVRGNQASAAAINDRGGVLGRRIAIQDCDDGPGEVSRAKACIKKLVGQDHIFSMITGIDWATASIHDDLAQYHLPYVGAWAYSQTEWQDPFMFPTHMSMIHEAMAGAHWAANTVHPATYGLICLTSPEMQLACNTVEKIMDASGSKLVKRADVSISETSMSAYVLSFRAAAPEHIIHYVINPATMAKFMVESQQQGYYPPKGISGNHLAGEVLGSLFGKWPATRYWTNTTYKLWGAEFMATMNKYARANQGGNHHIVQAGYVGMNIFAAAARAVGPNLTRDKLMAELDNGTVWKSDASLDQRFAYVPAERTGDNWNHDYGQGREFMYKYNSENTASNPDGSPNGWTPDPGQFVIYTWK
jgi:ABC-type branched-subunit amino acid transport system substrate-binding protein